MNKAWFLDRDGTIIKDQHYLKTPEKIVFLEYAVEALKEAQNAGYLLIVVTNQSGIARGLLTQEDADKVDARLTALLLEKGVQLTRIYRCPHFPNGIPPYNVVCDCRKPKLGMFSNAIKEYNLAPEKCLACGDKKRDIERLPELGLQKEKLGLIGVNKGEYPDLLTFFREIHKE